MNTRLNNSISVAVLLVLVLSVSWISCKKTEPAEAVITVIDSLGRAVSGATVTLFQDSLVNPNTGIQANVIDVNVSDLNGESFHSVDWEAVLNVKAEKGNVSGRDYVRLEQSKTVYKTVTIR